MTTLSYVRMNIAISLTAIDFRHSGSNIPPIKSLQVDTAISPLSLGQSPRSIYRSKAIDYSFRTVLHSTQLATYSFTHDDISPSSLTSYLLI